MVRLDHTVVEVLHTTGINQRYHVNFCAMDAKPKGDVLRVMIGVPVGSNIANGHRVDVPADRQADFQALVDEAIARRTTA